jgi:FKBP-type peptidyl-prolyl cis-trans isomerase SlpA
MSDIARVAADSHVTLHYRLSVLTEGMAHEVISTFEARPATLQLGRGQLSDALEARLVGLAEGQAASFEVAPAEGYGERNAELLQTLTRSAFDRHAEPAEDYAPGDLVQFVAPDGRRYAGVLKSSDRERVLVDFNHPLAGWPLRFEVQVIGVL